MSATHLGTPGAYGTAKKTTKKSKTTAKKKLEVNDTLMQTRDKMMKKDLSKLFKNGKDRTGSSSIQLRVLKKELEYS